MLCPSLLILCFTCWVEHLVPKTVSMLINLLVIDSLPNLLLSHIHILAVLHCLHHCLIQMVAFDIELMQEVVLVEIHHFLQDFSLINLLGGGIFVKVRLAHRCSYLVVGSVIQLFLSWFNGIWILKTLCRSVNRESRLFAKITLMVVYRNLLLLWRWIELDILSAHLSVLRLSHSIWICNIFNVVLKREVMVVLMSRRGRALQMTLEVNQLLGLVKVWYSHGWWKFRFLRRLSTLSSLRILVSLGYLRLWPSTTTWANPHLSLWAEAPSGNLRLIRRSASDPCLTLSPSILLLSPQVLLLRW